jgi:hypothetical protein
MAQVGVQTDIPAGRNALVPHGLAGRMPDQLVEVWDRRQFIPVEPVDAADPLIT